MALLAQFSFNESISNNLREDADLQSTLNDLHAKDMAQIRYKSEKVIYQSIKNVIEKIKWNLRGQWSCLREIKREHIMISYNTANRDLCLKIKERLESLGHKVWMDVNDLHGSNLEAIINAVESSTCMLMCVTERYRQSINCQTEARHAFKMGKKIIPMIMQADYEEVQGWLGTIMLDQASVNFAKNPYDECIRKLKILLSRNEKEIQLIQSAQIRSIDDWLETEVKDWFASNNLSMALYDKLKPCTGSTLKQLNEMRNTVPEFYKQTLSGFTLLNEEETALFATSLDKLFCL